VAAVVTHHTARTPRGGRTLVAGRAGFFRGWARPALELLASSHHRFATTMHFVTAEIRFAA
jgi:hypothetical protein